MCEHHPFRFDEDKAYEDQLVSVLLASPGHPLSAPEAPRQPGVFVLFQSSVSLYVGKAKDLRSRLSYHSKKPVNRKGLNVQEVTCRFLTIEKTWEVLRAKAALSGAINRNKTELLDSVRMFLAEIAPPACLGM